MNLSLLPRLSFSSFSPTASAVTPTLGALPERVERSSPSTSPPASPANGAARPQLVARGNSDENLSASVKTSSIPLSRSSSTPYVHSNSSYRRRRVSLDDEILRKNRKVIDNYLRRVGPHLTSSNGGGLPLHHSLALNNEGVCYFPYRKFVVVIEIPEDNPNVCFLYTMVCRLNARTDNTIGVMQHALHLNYMQQGTRGATVGLSGHEVNLCRTCPIAGLSAPDMLQLVDDFLAAAVDVNRQLDAIKQSGARTMSVPPTDPRLQEDSSSRTRSPKQRNNRPHSHTT